MTKDQKLYAAGAFFSLAGLVSSFWQLLDKIELLKHPTAGLSCNLNSVFNCGRVLNSHQYEVFGFPNAIIGIIMFSFFLTMMLVGVTGTELNRKFRLTAQALALFMLGFIIWFLFESTFRIRAICLFCTIIGPSVLIINGLILRLNQAYMTAAVRRWINRGADIFIWSFLLIIEVFIAVLKLG